MKYDVCFYQIANKNLEQLGQIRGFLRQNSSASMQVRIRPLQCNGELKRKYCSCCIRYALLSRFTSFDDY